MPSGHRSRWAPDVPSEGHISGNIHKKSNDNSTSNNTTTYVNGSSVEKDSTCPSHVRQWRMAQNVSVSPNILMLHR